MPDAKIIVIGDEILSGRTQDTNSYYLTHRLNELGINPNRIITIGDNGIVIEQVTKDAMSQADLIFICGGLGPTPDDHTIISVANVLNKKLVLDDSILKRVEQYFSSQGRVVPELATKQALIPQGAIVLDNPVGHAPGLIIKHGKKVMILLPGVTHELQRIFETGVIPFLSDTYLLKSDITLLIRTTSIPEMEIVNKINGVLKKYKHIQVAFLPSILGVDIKVSRIKDKKTCHSIDKDIKTVLKPCIYGYGQETIEQVVGILLHKKQLTLGVAESCTGGLVADKISNVAGSSEYFIGGAVVYSNKLKKMVTGVKDSTLRKFGAVSKETVLEMASGIRERFSTDIGISVSGIAGPTGATKDKPIGLVYIGIATKKGAKHEQYHFTGNRRMIKEKSAMAALDLLRRTIEVLS
ncbi:MAG: competence/damage-inducible protein A [Candidatus Latescibacteria bacterium]|nr:competence/damage-inducible protein A [Candidatus Latescibacterota bacterium]